MATIKMSYGAATAMTITLTSLANNTSATSSTVTNATNLYTDVLVEVIIVTTTVATTGYCEVFVKGSIDNTDFATDGGDRKLASIATPTAATTYKLVTSIAPAFGGAMPQFWQIRVRNASGGPLNGTSGGSAAYSGLLLTSA